MSERYRVPILGVTRSHEPGPEEYVQIGEDLLTPKELAVVFEASIYQRETAERQEAIVGSLKGLAGLREGVATIHQLEIDCANLDSGGESPFATITNHFLERLPIADIALAVAAKCSLTRWQDAHYVLEPLSPFEAMVPALTQMQFMMRRIEALGQDAPMPVRKPPKPVLIDGNGVPWYRVQVTEEPVRILSRQRRARVTPDFLRDVWRVYRTAQQVGEPTTQAVREWADLRTGRIPSNPTIFRWIKEARALYGEEQNNA